MTNDDGRLFVACICGFGFGIYTFFKGFRRFREYRVVADTPEIPIRSVPMGLVHIHGQAFSEETLVSPLTRKTCYLFKVVVEQWHSESRGGGEWKHVATDVQSVKFYLQDKSGDVLVDATNAELDLPEGPRREVRRSGAGASFNPTAQGQSAPLARNSPGSDAELLQYIEQARIRNVGQIVGRGISALSHASNPSRQPQVKPFLSFLADPAGNGGEAFRNQMIKAMLAHRDPKGETSSAALEVWKHPQGTPEFQAALARCAQTAARVMGSGKNSMDPAAMLAKAHEHPDQALVMIAFVAGAAEPQSDPEAEKARQAALAYGQGHGGAFSPQVTHTASGHYRLTECCILPGQAYDLTGTCTENPSPRDEHDRNIIVKGTHEPTFLISSKTEKQVESWLGKRAALMILGGAALAVVCLAVILGQLGLLWK